MAFGQFDEFVAARRQPTHLDLLAGRHRLGAFSSREPASTPDQVRSRLSLENATRLLARGLSQRLVDAVLPARTTILKVLQHVLVDTQRDQFLDAGNGYRLRRRLHHLGGGALERRFGLGARIVQGSRSPRLISHYQIPSNSAV